MSEELSNLTRIAKSAIIENVFSKRRKEVNEMKPSKLLGVLMASILTLGITGQATESALLPEAILIATKK